jgi:hypothetical protein
LPLIFGLLFPLLSYFIQNKDLLFGNIVNTAIKRFQIAIFIIISGF